MLFNLKQKWLTENPKYFETKYDAKLNYFFVIILISICYTISNECLLSKNYYTYVFIHIIVL